MSENYDEDNFEQDYAKIENLGLERLFDFCNSLNQEQIDKLYEILNQEQKEEYSIDTLFEIAAKGYKPHFTSEELREFFSLENIKLTSEEQEFRRQRMEMHKDFDNTPLNILKVKVR